MDVLNLSLPLFGLVLLGWLAARWKKIPESGLAWMQFYIIYVALPALFFQILSQTPIEQLTNFRFILGTTGTTLIIFAISFFFGRALQKNKTAVATMQAVAGSYSNIGYMGPALTLSALGEAAVVPTALILCFDNAMLFTIVPILMAMGMGDNKEGILKVLYKRVLLHPFILATIAGISAAYLQLEVPQAIDQILTNLKNSAAPSALFVMGVVIANQKASLKSIDVGVLLLIKMTLHPLLVYFTLKWIGFDDPVWVQTAVLMAALPPALNVFVLAQHYGVYVQRSSSIVLLGTLLAAISVTVLLYIIKSGWI
uniref:Transporter n=1 Tax=uncultured Thiotrichaceae bacterium TaxID=298394 RepID=A0A6S6UIH4_9GAMM|nr:MAG: Transporter [uncultured Thiotrichaceae bacterium]